MGISRGCRFHALRGEITASLLEKAALVMDLGGGQGREAGKGTAGEGELGVREWAVVQQD